MATDRVTQFDINTEQRSIIRRTRRRTNRIGTSASHQLGEHSTQNIIVNRLAR